jgi:hypothetical protein
LTLFGISLNKLKFAAQKNHAHFYTSFMKNILNLAFIFTTTLFTFSCKDKEDTKPVLQIPTVYESPNYTLNTLQEAALRKSLQDLTAYLKTGENISNKLDLITAESFFIQGNPSLESITAPYYSNLLRTRWLPDIVAASGNTYDVTQGASNPTGGIQGTRLLDQGGKEVLQEIEKGLFSAAFFNQIVALGNGNLSPGIVDRMLALYGAHPTFPNTNTASKTNYPDYGIALYAARRDKNDGQGIYTQIKSTFLKLKAAVEAGEKYQDEQKQAFNELCLLMERALMATVINYSHSAIEKFTKTNPTAVDLGNALHDVSENVGFVHGLKGVPQANRKITDAQIHNLLALFNAPHNAPATMYLFYNNPTEIAKLSTAINTIKDLYGFTPAEVNDFRRNWIVDQGR